MGTFARLSTRIYEDPAFAPLFLQGSAAGEEGRFGNVAYVTLLLCDLRLFCSSAVHAQNDAVAAGSSRRTAVR
jgi:hypothetical protein